MKSHFLFFKRDVHFVLPFEGNASVGEGNYKRVLIHALEKTRA